MKLAIISRVIFILLSVWLSACQQETTPEAPVSETVSSEAVLVTDGIGIGQQSGDLLMPLNERIEFVQY